MTSFDRRITPARPDRAAAHLRGLVEADVFVPGEKRTVRTSTAPLRREPHPDCPLDTEALRGEAVTVYEESPEGWSWAQLERDGYVGYLSSDALGPYQEPTHKVTALRTLLFPGPSLKMPIVGALSLGALVTIGAQRDGYGQTDDGFVWLDHVALPDSREPDFVSVAERFLGVPYLWGGRSSLGLDCSGLVQVALAAAGVEAPRDSDMQANLLGDELPLQGDLKRGDLVFWKGHVGIMRDAATLLHATAASMKVSSEPLAEARARIQSSAGLSISAMRRVPAAVT